jgi:hypothetical protein
LPYSLFYNFTTNIITHNIKKEENTVLHIDKLKISIPSPYSNLIQEIKKSMYIVDLKDNWDDEGAIGYSIVTWHTAVQFIINYTKWIHWNFEEIIESPKIYHGPKGSIDILWENNQLRLLINIDKESKTGMFYSDNYKHQVSEGSFELSDFSYGLLPIPLIL